MNQIGNIIPDFMQQYFGQVTRLETINHTKCDNCKGAGVMHIEGQEGSFECPTCHGNGFGGRDVIFFDQNKQVRLELQDNGRTLKIFINEREEDGQQ